MDTAAEDAVVGERAMAKLETELRRHGLQVVSVPAINAVPCAGIGGQARIQRIVDAPVGVAGIHGLLRFTVLADTDKFQTPPLLPISFLEAVGAIIDLSNETLRTPDGHETRMVRLPSGHPTLFASCVCSLLSNQNFRAVRRALARQLRPRLRLRPLWQPRLRLRLLCQPPPCSTATKTPHFSRTRASRRWRR